jgi:hypothetical protein
MVASPGGGHPELPNPGEELEMPNKLIGMDFAIEVLQTVLLTGQLDDEKPVSLLIIASPESGKTTATRMANISLSSDQRGEELAVALTDTTGKGLLRIVREHPQATHVIFNDLSITAGHKNHVVKYLFGVISAMTEEGLSKIADPGGIYSYGGEGVKGIIGCITPRLARDQRFIWNVTGLTTRMLPFFYEQGVNIQLKVRRFHAGLMAAADRADEARSLVVPSQKMHVHVDRHYREQILELADTVAKRLSKEGATKKDPDYKELGYRRIDQFRSLAKAHSLLTHPGDDEPRVHRKNVEFLRKLSRFVSFRKPEDLEELSSSSDSDD